MEYDQADEVAVEVEQGDVLVEAGKDSWTIIEPENVIEHEGPVDTLHAEMHIVDEAGAVRPSVRHELLQGGAGEEV